eukprot:m.36479 g.36479  ORF g.36479 m.36479 type:complete len:200 (+) comp5779_c1_seq1:1062-1661(+)
MYPSIHSRGASHALGALAAHDAIFLFSISLSSRRYSLLVDLANGPKDAAEIPQRVVAFGSFYLAKYHNQLRFSGIGEFNGWSTVIPREIDRQMREEFLKLLPGLEKQVSDARIVTGLRPYAASNVLILGQAPHYRNLYLNVGPGFNGWKCSYGSGRLLAAIIDDDVPKNLGFDASAFDPREQVKYAPLFCKLCTLFERE